MKSFLSFLVCAALIGGVTSAPAASAPPVAEWTLTSTFVSDYVFRGARLGGASLQPTLEMVRGRMTAGFWGNIPLDDEVPGVSDPELDLYGAWTHALGPRVALQPGFTLYHFPRADQDAGFYRGTFEPNLALSYTGDGFRLTPKVYYDLTLEGLTGEVTMFYALPLARFGSEIHVIGAAGTFLWRDAAARTHPRVKNWGDYWSLGVALPYALPGWGRVNLGLSYAEGTNDYLKSGVAPRQRNPAEAGRWVASVAYAFTF